MNGQLQSLLTKLDKLGIRLKLDDNNLKIRGATKSLNSQMIAEIKQLKPQLMAWLQAREAKARQADMPAIKPLPRDKTAFELSYSQQRLWFIDRLQGGSAEYNMPVALEVTGAFDIDAAEQAVAAIIQRHEVLRTVYQSDGDNARQAILAAFDFDLTRHDLTGLDPEAQQKQVATLMREDSQKGFVLEQDLMVRAAYIELAPSWGILLFNMHHIASDGWSMGILVREFVTNYQALVSDQLLPNTPLAIQYADYAHWQRQWLAGDVLAAQLSYWTKQLADIPAAHSLPLDRPRPEMQGHQGAMLRTTLDASLSKHLQQMATDHQLTPFMLLHGALALVLSKHSQSHDIVLGTTVANRRQAELDDLIGLFVNTLVLRANTDQQDITTYLSHIRQVNLDAQAHQDVPFEQLVEHCKAPRSTQHAPLFQILLSMNSNEQSDLSLAGVSFSQLENPVVATKFDLDIRVQLTDGRIGFNWVYDVSIFDRSHIESLSGHLNGLLASLAKAKTDSPLTKLSMLSDVESDYLLHGLNESAAADVAKPPQDMLMHEWFAAQVAKTPDAVALVFDDDLNGQQQLSYQALDSKANQLAHYLRAQGVEAETLVGICVERSPEMIIALLAILKAGGAYVPLAPDLPESRLQYMLEDTGLKLLLTQPALLETLAIPETVQCIALGSDALTEALQSCPQTAPARLNSDNASPLAYVIYTSGSTGKPKGVMVEHPSLVNFLAAMEQRLDGRLSAPSKWLAVTTMIFDIAGLEFWGPLCHGGQVVVASKQDSADPARLIELLEQHNIDCMQATPATWELLVNADWSGNQAMVALTGGEALPLPLAEQLLPRCAQLFNCYGPTEATIWSLVQAVEAEDLAQGRVPIAGGLNHYTHYVLDEQAQLLPAGAIGELHIGGAGLARGYLNRKALTDERFIANPFADNSRLYKTGDLVRYLPDGKLAFIGRTDDQVKLRGFRIELGEIEHQLLQHPQVTSAIVLAREDKPGQKRLVAYVIANDAPDNSVLVGELRETLQQLLPEYMLPSAYEVMEAFPLTANGKTDKKALPAPDSSHLEHQFVAATTEVQQSLVAIWCEVLQLDKVGIDDPFFDIGGNSLLTLTVQRKIQQDTPYQVELTDLFKYPTISALARFLESDTVDAAQAATIEQPHESTVAAETDDVAIIAMVCRMPGANDPDTLWDNVLRGEESITHYSDQQLLSAGVSRSVLELPNYVKSGVLLNELDQFDPHYFGFTPKEAQLMDPQQRLLFECANDALEQGGYGDRSQASKTGVFVGTGHSHYLFQNLLPQQQLLEEVGFRAVTLGVSKDYVATRLSHKLNLTGPSINVSTACSTSLVAIHQACDSLQDGSSQMALAGGCFINAYKPQGTLIEQGSIMSPDGRCRTFDEQANGTRGGGGAGVVLLKCLKAAQADGDTIHAVIKGSAINNDGADKVGFTAPSVTGQATVIQNAMAKAGVHPDSISYVEAHGTGTPMGDPIEMAALKLAYADASKTSYCAVGAIKPNIGHLDAAAGVAGLIKTVQMMKHRSLVPMLHYNRLNPHIDLVDTPFYINTEAQPWQSEGPLTAGISSFGIGGTNAHVIVQEAPAVSEDSTSHRQSQLIVLSAKSPQALADGKQSLAAHLSRQAQQPSLADIAHTLAVGRQGHAHRAFYVSDSVEDLQQALLHSPEAASNEAADKELVFMFPGQGSQYVDMAKGLYQQEPLFKQTVDECARLLQPQLDVDIRTIIYPADDTQTAINETRLTQPALFVVEYALATLWQSWGINPVLMIGHSVGEYVAACLAGVFTLEDALMLVAERGRLMQSVERGAMLSVPMSSAELTPLLQALDCSLAAVNGRENCVASGTVAAIDALQQKLGEQGIDSVRLQTSHAFHSSMMDPILSDFAALVASVERRAPKRAFVSNISGGLITPEQAMSVDYWVKHLSATVEFVKGLDTLLGDDNGAGKVFLEVGPGKTLTTLLARLHRGNDAACELHRFASVRHKNDQQSDEAFLLKTAGQLWQLGAKLQWPAFYAAENRRRVPLPGYAYQRQSCWIAPPAAAHAPAVMTSAGSLSLWQPEPVDSQAQQSEPARWLVFADDKGVAKSLLPQLPAQQLTVVVRPGQTAPVDDLTANVKTCVVDVGSESAYADVLSDTRGDIRVLHLWNLDLSVSDHQAGLTAVSGLGFLLKCLARHDGQVEMNLVTLDSIAITEQETLQPYQTIQQNLCGIEEQTEVNQNSYCIDLTQDTLATADDIAAAAGFLSAELAQSQRPAQVGYRNQARWAKSVILPGQPDKPQLQSRPAEPFSVVHQDSHEAPRNALEQQLMDIWQTLLGHDHIGIRDNFFDLGGDSLMAIRSLTMLKQTIDLEALDFSVRDLFDYPVLADAAAELLSRVAQQNLSVMTPDTSGQTC